MITPEQVMEELQYYITEYGIDYFIEIKNGKHFPVTTAYLSQQEKKDKLLELYRLKDDLIEEYQVNDSLLERQQTLGAIQGVREEIEALEEELK
jgi:hypothetical protein